MKRKPPARYGAAPSMRLAMDQPSRHPWRPEAPPDYVPADTVAVDFETTGLRWWGGDRPVGLAVAWRQDDQLVSHYYPWGHVGGNLDESAVRRFATHALAGKRLLGSKVQFDTHMAYQWGVDWEALGCQMADVQHQCALLDDNRRRFGLDLISREWLGEGKYEVTNIEDMASLHAGEVEKYARQDAELCIRLEEKFWPLLEEQELHEVRELEEQVIFVTCEMERNGVKLDVEKLDLWINQCEQLQQKLLWDLSRELGFKFEPKERDSLSRMFRYCGIRNEARTVLKGEESFTDDVLSKYNHPVIMKVRALRQYMSLDAKFLKNYRRKVDSKGILRYALHQMACDEGGTVRGRYSSSGMTRDEGVNIQQVAKPSKQKLTLAKLEKSGLLKTCPWLKEFIIRELFIPESGLWGKNDAKQIEYRIFAHLSRSKKILQAYHDDPDTDFHNIVMEMVRTVMSEITRDRTKDLNFAKIYGAGMRKIAVMLGFRSQSAPEHSTEGLEEVRPFVDAYDSKFPEAKALLRNRSELAESRGYVRTIGGRRARFPNGAFSYSALNAEIQGSAADIQKTKSLELARNRKRLGIKMRFVVHDEFDYDIPDLETAGKVAEILNRQSYDLRVPILWESTTGKNWKECK